jgi:hypothetical protein
VGSEMCIRDRFPAKPAGKGGCLGLVVFGLAAALAGLGWWITTA